MWVSLIQIFPFSDGLLTQQQFKVTHVDFVQGQHAQFIRDTDPFKYLGVTLTMSLSWSYHHKCMIANLTHELNALSKSYASPSQTKLLYVLPLYQA